MKHYLALLGVAILVQLLSPSLASTQQNAFSTSTVDVEWPIQIYANLLDLHHEPTSPTDRSHEIFFDEGSWQGYALPSKNDSGTGFVGPFLTAGAEGKWLGGRFASVELTDLRSNQPINLVGCDNGGVSLLGALARKACGVEINVKETLFFASASTALVRVTVTAGQTRKVRLSLGLSYADREALGDDRLLSSVSSRDFTAVRGQNGQQTFQLVEPLELLANKPATVFLQQSYLPATTGTALSVWNGSPQDAWLHAGERWHGYLLRSGAQLAQTDDLALVKKINAKAVVTLLGNWRAPLGDLKHRGLFPSYSNPEFNAFWSWDSWKHAAALSLFDPELAKDQVRALFDYQLPNGMIPDNVFRIKSKNNLRDSKPPLASWAVWSIYQQTHDRAFVEEMFDKLYRYHSWWYADRDHDGNGLAEYGSTDGTIEAARWESGMDNAVRFDGVAMLKNAEGAWSMNQESVDLNCYLYMDKLELAEMASVLGKETVARGLREQASMLRSHIQHVFFDKDAGYFFDVRLGSHAPVQTYGTEGWVPLWTNVATREQANKVASVIADSNKFNTRFPFPTLAKDDPRFAPAVGYWRGPVWIDQAVFAIQGLEAYGLAATANQMRSKLLRNTPGLAEDAPFRETYDPLTGTGQNSRNFGWSAAEYMLLIHNRPASAKPN